jgi:hypothetical protein
MLKNDAKMGRYKLIKIMSKKWVKNDQNLTSKKSFIMFTMGGS